MRPWLLSLIALVLLSVTLPVAPAARAEEEPPPPVADPEAIADAEREIERLQRELAELEARLQDLRRQNDPRRDARVLWTLDLASDSKGSGQVADLDGDGKLEIVFGTYFGDAHLYAVNAATGAVRFKHPSEGGPFDASVAIADLNGNGRMDTLAADSATGRLYCLDAEGKTAWTAKLPSGTDSPPAIGDLDGDGKPEVVVGTMWRRGGVGKVCAIDPRENTFLWQTEVKGCVQSEPALVDLNGDGTLDVIVTSWRGDRGIHALDGKNGEHLWTVITEGDEKSVGMYHGVSVLDEGEGRLRILAPTCAGDVYCLDASGTVLWRQQTGDYLFAPSLVADLDGDGKAEVFVAGRMMHCYHVADGTRVWENFLDGGSSARGAAAVDLGGDGTMELVLAGGTHLYILDGATSATRAKIALAIDPDDTYEKVSSAPLVDDFDGDGNLEAFIVCGRGYSGDLKKDNRGRAYAIRLGPGKGTWPTFRGNLRRTGVASGGE